MFFHFRQKFPQLNAYWDKYLPFNKRQEVPAKTLLLEEGRRSQQYLFIEKGCVRAFLNKDGIDKTVQFFFEQEGLASFESFQTPIDIIIDYLWGHSAELILACIKGKGHFNNNIRFVSIGSMAGDTIQLPSAILRSIDLQLTGSGLGAWTRSQVRQFFSDIMPEAFKLAAKGKLKAETIAVPMSNLATLWDVQVPNGQRLVVTL